MKCILIILFTIQLNPLFGQTWEDFYSHVSATLGVESVGYPIEIALKDERWNSSQPDLGGFIDELYKALSGFQLTSFDKSMTTLKLTVVVDYLNYFETESGNLYLKGLLSIQLLHSLKGNSISFRISAEEKIEKLRMKDLRNPKYAAYMSDKERKFMEDITSDLQRRLPDYLAQFGSEYKMVTMADRIAMKTGLDYKNTVIRNALVKACERAWGTQIESETTVIDFGDVTQKDFSFAGGIVHGYTVLQELETQDGYYCILLRTVVSKSSK